MIDRPKNILVRLGLALPWLTGGVLLVVGCVWWYLAGRDFDRGMHVFGWFLHIALGGLVFLAALATSLLVLVTNRRFVQQRRRLVVTASVIFASLVIPVSAFPLLSGSFHAGRRAGYQALDHQAIYDACVELQRGVLASGSEFIAGETDGGKGLPAALAKIQPLMVYVTSRAAIVRMDGGGTIMYDEGLLVILPGGRAPSYWKREPLHPALPVFMYRVDDDRGIAEDVHGA